MTLDRLRGEFRVLVGSPSVNTLPEREVDSFLIPSIQWLAGHLKFAVVTDSNIGLVAEQREYNLAPDFLYMIFLELNGQLLDPSTVWSLNSGASTSLVSSQSGVNWMTAPSSTPTQYAIQGRSLILYPPASAAVVAATPTMTWRYLSSGAYFTSEGQNGLTGQGIPALSDLDLQVVRYDAALAWLSAHMLGQPQDQVAAMQATIAAYTAEIARRLPECKRRWMDSIEDSHRTIRVDAQGRYQGAR